MLKKHAISSHYSTLISKSQCFLKIFAAILFCFAFLPTNLASAKDSTPAPTNYVSTNVNNFYFSDFTADYYLYKAEDGTSRLKVVEQFTAEFPNYDQNHGFIRVIPFTNQDGKNLTTASDHDLDISIKHNGVTEEPYDITTGDGYFEVTIREPTAYVHGTQYYELTYEFRNVIVDFSKDQELYWDTNGNDWQQKFNKVTARLHIDSEILNHVIDSSTSCYIGKYGKSDQGRCEIRRSGEGYEFIANNLSSGENLTFAVDFEPGTFAIAAKSYDYRFVIILGIEFAAISLLIGSFIYNKSKYSSKRKFYKNYFVKPEYQPAKDCTVAEMATNYMGNTSDKLVKVATLIELAVQGKIELIKLDGKDKWTYKVVKDEFTLAERNVLQVLAGQVISLEPGTEVEIKKHKGTEKLLKLTYKFNGYVKDALKAKGLYEERVKHYGGWLSAFAVLWLMAGFLGLPILFETTVSYRELVGGWLLAIVTCILFMAIAIASFIVSYTDQPYAIRTKLGLEYSRYMDGLKLYIKMAEADRIKFLQSVKNVSTSKQGIVKLYEKLLPYAIIFGQEKSWLKEMSRYYEISGVSNPTWYRTNGGFDALMFSSMVNSVVSSTNSSIASSYSYSSTSGSSSSSHGGGGGGFSGGGGGGGGGRGC